MSFDPVEWFLEDTTDERTWHDDPRDMPEGDIVAINLFTEDLDGVLADLPGGVVIPVVDLPNGKLTPENAAYLAKIRGLRVLHVSQDITDDVVAVLSGLSELEWLLIDGESLTDESLVHLGRLPKLRHLGVIPAGFRGESGASSLLPVTLEVLYITTRRGLDDRFVTALPPLPNLRHLHLRETWITDAALPKIGTFRALRELDLGNMELSDAGIAHLADLRRIEELDLDGSPITDIGFATLSKLASLEVLALVGTAVEALPGVENLPRLRTLDLRSSAVTDVGLGRLMALPNLMDLYLSDTSATDGSLAVIGAVRGLAVLRLNGTAVTNSGLRHLAGLEVLRSISLIDTLVTPEGLLALAALPRLREVEIGCGTSQAEMARLKGAMPNCEITSWDR